MSRSDSPAISVILPTYNCAEYLEESIQSILNQTFSDFELIIVNDGSTDDTDNILASLKDSRVRVYRQLNHGLSKTLNRAILLSRSNLIARQDADDISLPDRLEKQYDFMRRHQDYGLIGTWATILEGRTLSTRAHCHPLHDADIRYALLFNNPFVHTSVMFRRSVISLAGLYSSDPQRQPPEDYELWSRISRVTKLANIGEYLVQYREIPSSICRSKNISFTPQLVQICSENIAFYSSLSPDNSHIRLIARFIHDSDLIISHTPDFREMEKILLRAALNIGLNRRVNFINDVHRRIASIRASWHSTLIFPPGRINSPRYVRLFLKIMYIIYRLPMHLVRLLLPFTYHKIRQ